MGSSDITQILQPLGFPETASNPLTQCIKDIYNTGIVKALVVDISVNMGGYLTFPPVLRFRTVLKEKEDFSNKVLQEAIDGIAQSHVKLSRLFDVENIDLQTQLSIFNPTTDPLSEPSEISEILDKLQMVGISTKRTLAYLLFEHPTN